MVKQSNEEGAYTRVTFTPKGIVGDDAWIILDGKQNFHPEHHTTGKELRHDQV